MELALLSPVLQAGAFGVCGLLIWLLWWLLGKMLAAFRGNTSALENLIGLVSDVRETSEEVRDRLLEWQCPFGEREQREERIRQSHILPDPDAPIGRTLKPAGTK